jgi:PAS domain S-box-containing protein
MFLGHPIVFMRHLILWADRHANKSTLHIVFTTVLVVPFLIQILLAVGVTGWLSLRSGQQSVNEVAAELRNEVAQRIHDELHHYLDTPHQLNQLNASAARAGEIDFDALDAFQQRLWRQAHSFSSLSSLGFGSVSGEYVSVSRALGSWQAIHKNANQALEFYDTNYRGEPTQLTFTGKPGYDPRDRDWYQQGKNAPTGRWSRIFTYSDVPEYLISAVRPVYNPDGVFQGVLMADLLLSDLSTFLQTLEVGTSGETFIIERSGLLVAASTPQLPFKVVEGTPTRLAANMSSSPLIRATAADLSDRFNGLSDLDSVENLSFRYNGQRQFVQVLPYQDNYGLDWLIVVTIPEADFMAQIEANRRITLVLCAIALAIATLVGLVTADWLVRPILRLSAAATAVAAGDWDKSLPLEREDEIGVLAAAFDRMVGQLQESLAALEEREAKLAEAQAIAHLGSWEYNSATRKLIWSQELYRIYGLDPNQSPPADWQSCTHIHAEDLPQLRQTIENAIAERQSFSLDHRIIRSDGELRYVHSKGQICTDRHSQELVVCGTVMDITERKKAEIERSILLEREKTAREAAEAANRIKDEFLAVLSHELRTPLNPILGWTNLLRERKLDPDQHDRALETIERNAKLQIQLIDDLLDVSRILQGKLVLNEQPVDLREVVRAAIDTLHLATATKKIAIATDFEAEGCWVKGDPNRLQQVMWNLLSNAIKFTPAGGGITIALACEGDCAQIQVRDSGKGIDPQFLPHIFEYFRQEDSTTTRNFGGLGLGLAIVRHLVELHGGWVKVESAGLGKGTSFTVSLPRVPHLNTKAKTDCEVKSLRLQDVKILAVDDDPDNLELLAFALNEMYGANVTAVKSARASLEAIAQSSFDLLIADIGMPEMDGYDLIAELRQKPKTQGGSLPAIALTAYASDRDHQAVMAAGFDLHASKPFDIEYLADAIADLLARDRAS